jgi:glycosyltransferase involved in cell wall biosynthesis
LSGRTADVLRRVLARSGRRGAPGRREVPGLAILSTWKTRCGIAGYTRLLTESLPRGLEFSIHAEAGSPEPENDRIHRSWQYGLSDLSLLERDLKAAPPAFLLIQHHPGFFEGDRLRDLLALCRGLGIPAGVTLHTVRNWKSDPSVTEELERASRVFVHRDSDAELLRERGVVQPVRVIPQGIPRLWRRPKEQIRAAFGMPGGFWIGHFGYLRPHKGTVKLIEAFDRLALRRPDARLLLLCSRYPSKDSAAYAEVCTRRIAASPYRTRIHASFDHLPFEEVASLLQACDVTVFPYAESDESSSAAARLAVAAHKPVVVSRSRIFEDLEDVAEHLPEDDPGSIAGEVDRLADDPGRIEKAAERARRFAARNDWRRVAALTLGNLPPEALTEIRRSTGSGHSPEP